MVANTIIGWSSFAFIATGLLVVGPSRTLAQSSTAVCLPNFNWMSNSMGQNPCLVTAYLAGACNGGQFTVDPLAPNTHYTGPYVNEQNQCQCSSVTYNAISACGLCQNSSIVSWSSWDYNCSIIYPGVFPPGVPYGTAVPAWMYQDVTTSNMFNVTLAQLTGDFPEATATRVQSTGSLVPTSASVSFMSTTPTATPSSGATSGSSSSNTGAIAGGVVGGVVGIALIIGAIVFFVMRKKRSQMAPSAQYATAPALSNYPATVYSESNPFSPPPVMTQPRLYDPSDPSTFPITPPPPTVMTSSSGNFQNPSISYSTLSRPGGYSGVPEV